MQKGDSISLNMLNIKCINGNMHDLDKNNWREIFRQSYEHKRKIARVIPTR